MLNDLELRKLVFFEIVFSLVSAYAEHLITLVTEQHVPTDSFAFLSETDYL